MDENDIMPDVLEWGCDDVVSHLVWLMELGTVDDEVIDDCASRFCRTFGVEEYPK